jgi:hypothetical protein
LTIDDAIYVIGEAPCTSGAQTPPMSLPLINALHTIAEEVARLRQEMDVLKGGPK